MNNEQLATQLRDLGNAAQSLATAITMLYANLSINIPSVDEQQEQNTNHCGQDALEENTPTSLKELLGLQVIGIGKGKCDGCPVRAAYCRKVELVGGVYVCLAVPHKDGERPVIIFDEESDDVMDGIRKKAEDFMEYLDSVVRTGDDEKV
jgi:hypothetical protein